MTPFQTFGGLGDHVLWLGLLANISGPKTVVCDPRMEGLVRLYEGRTYTELIVTDTPPRDAFICWHGKHVGDERGYVGLRDMTIADVVREILRLPKGAEIVPPVWEDQWFLRLVADGIRPKRTVLLAPWAHTAQVRLPDQWWADAARWLMDEGWTVATNVSNRGRGYDQSRQGAVLEAIPGTVPVDIPLNEIGPFAELCGAVLCARSGLSDLLARCRTRMCVVWPVDVERNMPSAKERAVWSVRGIYGSDAMEVAVDHTVPFSPERLWGWLSA
jgi:hypothetical protein